MVVRDPFELFVAQNIVIDGLIYPLVYDTLIDSRWALEGAAPASMLTQFMSDWGKETRKWADSVVKIAANESVANAEVIGEWCRHWSERAVSALLPVIAKASEEDADQLLADVLGELKARLAKAGICL